MLQQLTNCLNEIVKTFINIEYFKLCWVNLPKWCQNIEIVGHLNNDSISFHFVFSEMMKKKVLLLKENTPTFA